MASVKPNVVWFNIDSLRADVFYKLLDSDKLPNFGLIFGKARRAKHAVSVFPTVTMTCQASLATGATPARHLIGGNAWFDRFGKRPFLRDYTDTETSLLVYGYKLFGLPTGLLAKTADEDHAIGRLDLSGATPTLYDALKARVIRTGVVFTAVSRGAKRTRPRRALTA
ncbi:MAG TPA: alkaline phosphatase family protein, partial [bacterium]|nr:alkaline phosphatase family protein [bacterium]